VELRTIYRNNGAIAAVAESLRCAEADRSPHGLEDQLERLPAGANLRWQPAPPQRLPASLLARLRTHQANLQELCQGLDPHDGAATARLLAALDSCLVLSPRRRGRWGVDAIHRALLGEEQGQPIRSWPNGTPVLCQHNLSELGLANGDVGLVVDRAEGRRLLFSPAGSGDGLWIHPAQLPSPQPALALTIHKAQGSEAEEVWVLMPDTGRPVSRLLYTALTRARRQAYLITPDSPHADQRQRRLP
jgi:exodeoxyribonuclease V alpha subunit